MTLKVSVGLKAWLDTTDDRRPLSDYRTVLEGTIFQIAELEAEAGRLTQRYSDIQDEYLELHNEKSLLTHELRKALRGE